MLNNDIPPLPPSLTRKASFNAHQQYNRHPVSLFSGGGGIGGGVGGSSGANNMLIIGSSGGGGTNNNSIINNNNNSYINNHTSSSSAGGPGGVGISSGSNAIKNGTLTRAVPTTTGAAKLNNCENNGPAMNYSQLNNKPDLFNFSSTATIDNKSKLLLNDATDELQLNMKPYPPFYFDDNHFHHCGGGGVGGGGIGTLSGKENEVFFYHHEPGSFIPNYDTLSYTTGKYNTIGPTVGGKMHASTCNLNHFHETNLISGHNYSTSLSNFSQATPHLPYHQFHTGALGLGYGGSSLIGGSFNSNGSIGAMEKQKEHGLAWKNRNCPSRNSSSSGTNSGSKSF